MRKKTDAAAPAHRFVAACVAALLVLALAPGVVLAGDGRPAAEPSGPARPAASALTGLDGLWGALAGAWDGLSRLFAADGAGESSGSSSTTGGEPPCEPDCETPPDIDPNG